MGTLDHAINAEDGQLKHIEKVLKNSKLLQLLVINHSNTDYS